MTKIRVFPLLILFILTVQGSTLAKTDVFLPIGTRQGLSDNQIRYILQLGDGRMVFTTSGNINLYDGGRFTYLHRNEEDVYPLKQYDGYYRMYCCGDSLLWIKDMHKLYCVRLHTQRYVRELDHYFRSRGLKDPVENLFVDRKGDTWTISGQLLTCLDRCFCLPLNLEGKRLQDLDADEKNVYLFYNTGEIECYDYPSGQWKYRQAAYEVDERPLYGRTSLIVRCKNGFYQLRNGSKGALFHFDTRSRIWKKLFGQDYTLNTFILGSAGIGYISCINGYWKLNFTDGSQEYIPLLKIRGQETLTTEISTIFEDRQGGLWIGTFNRGLLYTHAAMYRMHTFHKSAFPVSSARNIEVEGFAEDSSGHIYLKSHADIFKIGRDEYDNLKLIKVTDVSQDIQAQLRHYTVTLQSGQAITCKDSRGWIWQGTSDGLYYTDTAGQRHVIYKEDGLTNNFIQSILEDSARRIWVATGCGISCITIDAGTGKLFITNYMPSDGTLDGEYTRGAAFQATNGMLYFGGVDGFSIYNPHQQIAYQSTVNAPLFIGLQLFGKKVEVEKSYHGRILLPEATPYLSDIVLDYNQNYLTFEFSALNYVNRSRTYYRYRLKGLNPQWNVVSMYLSGGRDETDGILRISYTDLPPGKYTLQVMASEVQPAWDGPVTELHLTISAPWWKTDVAYVLYGLLLTVLGIVIVRLYVYRTKKSLARRHKEEILLMRIQNLIEQCNRYERGRTNMLQTPPEDEEEQVVKEKEDAVFLNRAIDLVEKNLTVTGYSVEQLSRDLCMERTGLYKKLKTLLDQSPSLFIRNIRLRRAAQLLLENKGSIAQIADVTGFSSSSYMSKCFQEMYGCRPSEYVEKLRKST